MTPPRAPIGWPILAADEHGPWTVDADDAPDASVAASSRFRPVSLAKQAAARRTQLHGAVEQLVEVAISSLSDAEVRQQLASVEAARRLLEARSCRLTSALTSRADADARAATRDDDPRAGERAARQIRAELVDELRLTPSAVLGAQKIGDRVDASPLVAAALDAGTITADHVRAIDRTLRHLTDTERETTEARLVEVATTGTRKTRYLPVGHLTVTWTDGRPTVHPPDQPPDDPP